MNSRFLTSHAVVLALITGAVPCLADTKPRQSASPSVPTGLGFAGASALAATLSRADVAAMRSVVQPNLLKGGFGEAHMNRHLLGYLKQTEKWSPLSARLGPQGMDGLLIRYDTSGTPCGLIVSEAKYGTSRLKMTSDGIQMGTRWRSVRLGRMASEYRAIAQSVKSGRMALSGPGGSVGRQRLQIPLADGKVAVFTRSRTGDPWEFVGPRALMDRAGRQVDLVADYLQLASDGKVAYESPIYRMVLKNDNLRVTIRDASMLSEQVRESGLPVLKTIPLPLGADRLNRLRNMSRVELAKILRQKYPAMSSSDVDHYSREIVRTTRDFEKLLSSRPWSVANTIAWNSLKIGVGMAAIDVAIQAIGQYRESGTVDWGRVGLSGGISLIGTGVGAAVGQGVVVFMTQNTVAYQIMSRSSTILGLGSRSLATNILGGAGGGGVATMLIAYGGYLAGLYDLETANRKAIAEGSGLVAGAVFAYGMFALVSTIGTASTGTAIVTLSGASLTSATFAWIGGGSLAAGGLGVSGGTVVLTGGAALVAIATALAVHAIFVFSDSHQDFKRIRLTLDDLLQRKRFTLNHTRNQRFQTQTISQD